MSSKSWYLFNDNNNKKISGYDIEFVVKLCYSMSDAERDQWWFQYQDEESWVNLKDFLNSVPNLEDIVNPLKVNFPDTSEVEKSVVAPRLNVVEQGFESNIAKSTNVAGVDDEISRIEIYENYVPRQYKRHKLNLKIILNKEGNIFETSSVDISVHGMKIKDKLPDWAQTHCMVQIINEDSCEEVQTICTPMSDQGKPSRTRIRLSQFRSNQLEAIFDEWLSDIR